MAGVSVTVAASTHPIVRIPVVAPRRGRAGNFFLKSLERQRKQSLCCARKQKREIACAKLDMQKQGARIREEDDLQESQADDGNEIVVPMIRTERMVRKQKERSAYLLVAVLSSLGVTSMIAASVYYRFLFQTEGAEIPVMEMVATFALTVGAVVGMEFWARWAHRALWHDSLRSMHESHHRPREGPFELNDVFAIINAVPAMALLAFGFHNKGLLPGLCFGAGLGITVYGMAYMFVHDGLVHKRFPVGPIANVPYLRRVAAAHQLHHNEKLNGVPYGLFFGPEEVEKLGGSKELEKEINRRIKASQSVN